MAYLIGTDEAGYGPNLGPLIISASAWEVPDGLRSEDLYRQLDGIVAASPAEAAPRVRIVRPSPTRKSSTSRAKDSGCWNGGSWLPWLRRDIDRAAGARSGRSLPHNRLSRKAHSLGTTGMKLACRWIAMRPKSTILLPCFRRAWPKPESG